MRKRDQLNTECPENFCNILNHPFIVELNDKKKVNLVQVYLGVQKSFISYIYVKKAVEKAYQRFRKLKLFDNLHNQLFSPLLTSVQSELVALFQVLKILLPIFLQDNLPHHFNYSSANIQDQNQAINELQKGSCQYF